MAINTVFAKRIVKKYMISLGLSGVNLQSSKLDDRSAVMLLQIPLDPTYTEGD